MDPPRLTLPGNLARSLRYLDDGSCCARQQRRRAGSRAFTRMKASNGRLPRARSAATSPPSKSTAGSSTSTTRSRASRPCPPKSRAAAASCCWRWRPAPSRLARRRPLSLPDACRQRLGQPEPAFRRARQPAARRDQPAREIGGHLRRLNGWKIERDKLSAAMAALTFAQRKCAGARISARSQQRTS